LLQWDVDNAEATPEEQVWLQANVSSPVPVPWLARIAFVLTVAVSTPWWWKLVKGYVSLVMSS